MPLNFPGSLLSYGTTHILVYGAEAEALGPFSFGPPVYLQPGYHLLAEPDYLLPNEVIDDIGQHIAAPDCYAWLEERGDMFPRADVIGQRATTGAPQTVFLKELDLIDVAVFAGSLAGGQLPVRVELAIDTSPMLDDLALAPIPFPIPVLDRGLLSYRLAPGTFGAVSAALLNQLLRTRRTDWRLTFDQLDDLFPD